MLKRPNANLIITTCMYNIYSTYEKKLFHNNVGNILFWRNGLKLFMPRNKKEKTRIYMKLKDGFPHPTSKKISHRKFNYSSASMLKV